MKNGRKTRNTVVFCVLQLFRLEAVFHPRNTAFFRCPCKSSLCREDHRTHDYTRSGEQFTSRVLPPRKSAFPRPRLIYRRWEIGKTGKRVFKQGVFPRENAWKSRETAIFCVFPLFQVESCFPARKNPFSHPSNDRDSAVIP